MLNRLKQRFPSVREVTDLSPEDLAEVLLTDVLLNTQPFSEDHIIRLASAEYNSIEAAQAIIEAVNYLQGVGLLATSVSTRDALALTRRGRRIAQDRSFSTFRQQRLSLYEALDDNIRTKVWAIYLRGDYDIAISQAFKQIEIAMRSKGSFPTSDTGDRLIKKFFREFSLRTSDATKPDTLIAEEHLFIGANALYRNPAVHEDPTIEDPVRAAEVLLLANHMLHLVTSAYKRQQH